MEKYKKILEESVDYIGIDNNYHTKKRYRVLQRDIDTNLWQLSTFINTNFEEVPAIFDDKDTAIAFAKDEIGMIHLRELNIKIMEKLWIARDKNGYLYLYNNKPIRNKEFDSFEINDDESECKNIILYDDSIELDSELFPEVTWENSPQQVELKLIKNDSNS